MIPSRILVIGSGGREHALLWRLARDPHAPRLWWAPGPDAATGLATPLAFHEEDARAAIDAARELAIELVVIGPEAPLAAGVGDALVAEGFLVFGASRAAAALESSKWFAKEIMRAAGVPTAPAQRFEDARAAIAALSASTAPWVVKADGLAAGKGVCVTSDRQEAEAFVRACLERGRFGAGGSAIVLEEFLQGEEASLMAVCDGESFVWLPAARDHKRAFEGDQGANTGGMGAYAPSPAVTPGLEDEVGERVVMPVLAEMRRRGTPFRGLLYCGIMITPSGPSVVEFNVRFGDPETQCVLPLVTGSFSGLLASAARGALEPAHIGRAPGAAVAVALVDQGYPEVRTESARITGLDPLQRLGLTVFEAAVRREGHDRVVVGGRAAYVMAQDVSIEQARQRVYAGIQQLGGSGWRSRQDIAAQAADSQMRSVT